MTVLFPAGSVTDVCHVDPGPGVPVFKVRAYSQHPLGCVGLHDVVGLSMRVKLAVLPSLNTPLEPPV